MDANFLSKSSCQQIVKSTASKLKTRFKGERLISTCIMIRSLCAKLTLYGIGTRASDVHSRSLKRWTGAKRRKEIRGDSKVYNDTQHLDEVINVDDVEDDLLTRVAERLQQPEHKKKIRHQPVWNDYDNVDEQLDDVFFASKHEKNRVKKAEQVFLKRKIIERKFFKKEREAPLLTWEAMSQIRYLNSEYPDDWTLDKLNESFPVSRHALIRILQTKHRFASPEMIKKHNDKVRRHWQALKSGKFEHDKHLVSAYEGLKESGKLSLMVNAAGLQGVPMPVDIDFKNMEFEDLQALPGGIRSKDLKHTPFSSILKKHGAWPKSEENSEKLLLEERKKRFLDYRQKESVMDEQLLLSFSNKRPTTIQKSRQEFSSGNKEPHYTENTSDKMRHNEKTSLQHFSGDVMGEFDFQEKRLSQTIELKYSRSHGNASDQSNKDLSALDSGSFPEKSSDSAMAPMTRRQLRQQKILAMRNKSKSTEMTDKSVEELQMIGTRKVTKTSDRRPFSHSDEELAVRQAENLSLEPEELGGHNSVYSEDSFQSQQHNIDFGSDKNTDALAKTKIVSKNGITLHLKGNSVYDEDGEFLYRIP